MAKSVLITGARAAAALDIARDFAKAGWQVHMADSVVSRMAQWSSLGAVHHLYPSPRLQRSAFRATIAELVEAHRFDCIVPTCEEVFHIATPGLQSVLGSLLFAPSADTLRTLHDKLAFAKAAQTWGLCAPESHAINHADDWMKFRGECDHWVFKPRFSRFGGDTQIAPSRDQFDALTLTADGQWMAQRCIHGEEVCLHAVAHHGELVAFAAYSSDWRLKGGASYAFTPVSPERHNTLRSLAKELAYRAAIHGQFGCDVIFEHAGEPHCIECNPRATSGVHLLTGDGALARAIVDGAPLPEMPFRPAFLAPAMAVFGLKNALASGRMANWRAMLAQGKDAITAPGDRLPFAGAIVDSTLFALKALRHQISTNAATTHDIEWNGEELD